MLLDQNLELPIELFLNCVGVERRVGKVYWRPAIIANLNQRCGQCRHVLDKHESKLVGCLIEQRGLNLDL